MPPHDPRRPERVQRYQPSQQADRGSPSEHINALGMVCSLLGLLIRVSWLVFECGTHKVLVSQSHTYICIKRILPRATAFTACV